MRFLLTSSQLSKSKMCNRTAVLPVVARLFPYTGSATINHRSTKVSGLTRHHFYAQCWIRTSDFLFVGQAL